MSKDLEQTMERFIRLVAQDRKVWENAPWLKHGAEAILERIERESRVSARYEMQKVRRGYEVIRCGSRHGCTEGLSGDRYLVSVRNGVCTWCEDFTYARHYSLETASKHIKALREGDIA